MSVGKLRENYGALLEERVEGPYKREESDKVKILRRWSGVGRPVLLSFIPLSCQ